MPSPFRYLDTIIIPDTGGHCTLSTTVQNTKASKTGHTHDDRYYTESEIDTRVKNLFTIKSFSISYSADKINTGSMQVIPYTIPSGYKMIDAFNVYTTGCVTASCYQWIDDDGIHIYVYNLATGSGKLMARVLFQKL